MTNDTVRGNSIMILALVPAERCLHMRLGVRSAYTKGKMESICQELTAWDSSQRQFSLCARQDSQVDSVHSIRTWEGYAIDWRE
jgi:hypothetical protein